MSVPVGFSRREQTVPSEEAGKLTTNELCRFLLNNEADGTLNCTTSINVTPFMTQMHTNIQETSELT